MEWIYEKNTEFAGNKNSNNSSTVVHIYSHAAENQATNVITESTLDTDNIFEFPELEQQQENASTLIDSLVSRHTSDDLSK